MNREQKLTAILERLKEKGTDFDGGHMSMMVICGYLDDLGKLGLIESAFAVTPMGKNIQAICEEFDWKPDDDEIKAFVTQMVEGPQQPAFMYMIKKWRDDREGLKEDFKKSLESGEVPPTFGGQADIYIRMRIKLCPTCSGTLSEGPEGFKTKCSTCKGTGVVPSNDPADEFNELVEKSGKLVIVKRPN